MTLDDPKHEAAADFSKLKNAAEREAHDLRSGGARSTSEPLGPNVADPASREAARAADNARYGAERATDAVRDGAHKVADKGRDAIDEVKSWGDKLAGDARSAADRATTTRGHEFSDEVHRWGDALRSGPSERQAWKPTLDELKRFGESLRGPDREYGLEQVEKAFKSNGVDVGSVTSSSNPYLAWVGPGHSLRRGAVERKLRDFEYEVRPCLCLCPRRFRIVDSG